MINLFLALSLFVCTSCYGQYAQLAGMTCLGGSHSCGTIFMMNADGSALETVHSFDTLTGMNPYGTLLQAADGMLYGLTFQGGAYHAGTLFRFDPYNYIYTALFHFSSSAGSTPYGSLIQGSDGKLYGLTYGGGAKSRGVIFSYDIAGNTYTRLHDFIDSSGAYPKGSLLQAVDGKLYGVTASGGPLGKGVLFSYDIAANTYKKEITINSLGGNSPLSHLAEVNGNLYSTTAYGGTGNAGTLFRFNLMDETALKLLDYADRNQQLPSGAVTYTDGFLYGMTNKGGEHGAGTIYRVDTTGTIYSTLFDFDSLNGAGPLYNTLMRASDNKFYSMTPYGGAFNDGVVFSYDPATATFTKLVDFNGTNGKSPFGTLTELKTITAIQTHQNNMHSNLVNDELHIPDCFSFEIFNTAGQCFYKNERPASTINVSFLKPGIYFVKLLTNQKNITIAKMVKMQ